MSEKYKVKETRYAGGTREVIVTRQPTAGDYLAGGAVVAGVAGGALVSSRQKAARRRAEAALKLLDDGNVDGAMENANALIQYNDKEAKVVGHYLKGMAFLIDENSTQAIEEFSSCIRMAEETGVLQIAAVPTGKFLAARGSTYLEIGELGKALNDFSRLTQLLPQDDHGYYWRGRALRNLGDLEQALANLNRAIELNPSDGANYRERGLTHAAKHSTQTAIDDYSRAITLDGTDTSALQFRGQLYTSLGKYQNAIADYSEAIRLAPTNIECYGLRAQALRLAGNVDASEADLAHIAKEEPLRQAYTDYLEAARAMTAHGIITAYTRSDTHAKWNIKIFLQIVFVLGPVISGSMVVLSVVTGERFLMLIALVLLVILIGGGISGARTEAKERKRLSNLYFERIAETDERLPGFELFFTQYLLARKDGTMQNLSRDTRHFFETGGPCHSVLSSYVE